MKFRVFAVLLLSVLLSTISISPVDAQTQKPTHTPDLTLTIGGISADRMGQSVCFQGTYHITRFTAVNNQLFAEGQLNGPLTNCNGQAVGFINNQFPMNGLPVKIINGSCQQITITLAPGASFPLPSMKRVLMLGPVTGGDLTLTSKVVHHKFCKVVKSGQTAQDQARILNKILGL